MWKFLKTELFFEIFRCILSYEIRDYSLFVSQVIDATPFFLVPFSGSGHSWFTMWPHLVTEPVIYLIPFFLQKRRPTSRPAPKSNGCGGWGCTRGQSQGSYRYEPRELFTYVLFQGGHLEFFFQISFWNESVILTLPSKNSAQHHHSSYGAGFTRNVPEIFL